MKKISILMLIIILTLQIGTAFYSGETVVIEFEGDVRDCYISDNQSDLIGLTLIENGSSVIISTVQNYAPDNFTLNCMVRGELVEKKENSNDWTIVKNITNYQFVNFYYEYSLIINIALIFSVGLTISFIGNLIIKKR